MKEKVSKHPSCLTYVGKRRQSKGTLYSDTDSGEAKIKDTLICGQYIKDKGFK